MYSACTQTERKFVIIYFYDVIRNKFVVGGTLAEREAISRNVIRNTSFSALPGVKEKQNSEEARGEDVCILETNRSNCFVPVVIGGRKTGSVRRFPLRKYRRYRNPSPCVFSALTSIKCYLESCGQVGENRLKLFGGGK